MRKGRPGAEGGLCGKATDDGPLNEGLLVYPAIVRLINGQPSAMVCGTLSSSVFLCPGGVLRVCVSWDEMGLEAYLCEGEECVSDPPLCLAQHHALPPWRHTTTRRLHTRTREEITYSHGPIDTRPDSYLWTRIAT